MVKDGGSSRLSQVGPNLWCGLVLFRALGSLLLTTYFNADEYWQGPEVAHRLVFGYGHLTWEWSLQAKLRSIVHPGIYAILFKLLQISGLDSPLAVRNLPRLFQGLLLVVVDAHTYKFAKRLFGPQAAFWALFCSASSWFLFFCGSRTFSNSMEMVFVSIALCWWPLSDSDRSNPQRVVAQCSTALVFAGVSVIMRPTAALVWVVLGVEVLLHLPGLALKFQLLLRTICIGGCAVAVQVVADRLFYGTWTFVPWNFAAFNLISGLDRLYGAHPWHWYASQGLPAVAGTSLPLLCYGQAFLPARREVTILVRLLIIVVGVMSLGAHKEFRFLLPLVPIFSALAGRTISFARTSSTRVRYGLVGCVIANMGAAAYLGLVHQRGAIVAVDRIMSEIRARRVTSIHFLTPCHATPYYASIHAPLTMRFLDCSPPMMLEDMCSGAGCHEDIKLLRREVGIQGFEDWPASQAQLFEAAPARVASFLYRNADSTSETFHLPAAARFQKVKVEWDWGLPSHIVIFDGDETEQMRSVLDNLGYQLFDDIFHAAVQGDVHASRDRGRVHIWRRRP